MIQRTLLARKRSEEIDGYSHLHIVLMEHPLVTTAILFDIIQSVVESRGDVLLTHRIWQLTVNLPPHLRVFGIARCIQDCCCSNSGVDSWNAVLRWSCESEDFGKLPSREWGQALRSSLWGVLATCGCCDKLDANNMQLKRWAALAYVFCVRYRKLRRHVAALTRTVVVSDVLAPLRSCLRNLDCNSVRVWCHSLGYQVRRGWHPCQDVPASTFQMVAQRRCQSLAPESYHPQAWSQLSGDVLRTVMLHLRPRALCRIASVCKHWNATVNSCPVWNSLYSQRYGETTQCSHGPSFRVSATLRVLVFIMFLLGLRCCRLQHDWKRLYLCRLSAEAHAKRLATRIVVPHVSDTVSVRGVT